MLGLSAPLGACSVEEAAEGKSCIRSTECKMGLVCIAGTCSSDLSQIEDPGEVPQLMPDAGMDMQAPRDGATADMGPNTSTDLDAAMTAPQDGG